ncbi:hypothetical protein CPU12_08135 [Malaciobacter molluscorum LMG 25693]|uniref:FAD/FMN-containing dehydrogenase n=1 Tax=Malaciobacter molluscorum LMG 25693 TaxID=870501 RepID=A0A2G1DHH8_9BACT|nr:hypothetical protein [Malaciobacter molluscorum]AXX93696.1 hypothetical protein AMOL_2763 [Malaciobacter molluscorum LMG 25693]PHO17894.1 hypothetical protein CPU12_08135 [Malaciobacter molluscorum LMG 25693]
MKKIILIVCLVFFANAKEFHVKDNIGSFSLLDQFDTKHTINKNIKTIIVSFEKQTSKDINKFLNSKNATFLKEHNAVFIANISGMPTIITKLFALPKMKEYKHKILLIYDDADTRFKSVEGKSTLYRLKNGVITQIKFITKDDLQKVFE